MASSGYSDGVGDECPGIDFSSSAGFGDAQDGGISARAFVGPCSKADAPRDDGVPEGCLRIVIGGRQFWIGDESRDGVPVIEDFAGERAGFCGIRVFVEKGKPA